MYECFKAPPQRNSKCVILCGEHCSRNDGIGVKWYTEDTECGLSRLLHCVGRRLMFLKGSVMERASPPICPKTYVLIKITNKHMPSALTTLCSVPSYQMIQIMFRNHQRSKM